MFNYQFKQSSKIFLMAFLGVQNFTDSDNVANSILKVHVTELLKLASSHALRACDEAFFLAKKKTCVFLFYIYNFYFDNLIYKWIKQFEN